MTPAKPLLRRNEATEYLLNTHGVTVASATLARKACVGGGPRITYFGRFPHYAPADLDAWVASQRRAPVGSTSEKVTHG